MEVRIEKPKPSVCEMHITVSYEQYAKEKERITESYRHAAEVPGFRKGRAPVAIVASNYRSQIEKEAKERFIRSMFAEAVREHHIVPLTYAQVVNFDASEETGVVTFSAMFQVIPDFELSLDGLHTSYEAHAVNNEQVAKVLEELQEKYTTVRPATGPSKEGDTVEFDYVAYDTSGAVVDSAQGMAVTCSERQQKGTLTSALLGVKPGEEREAAIPYPSTFPVVELEGRDVRLTLSIKEVKEAVTPPLDDEFAKVVGMDSLRELKNSIKRQLEDEGEMKARAGARNRMIEKLLGANEFEVPSSLINFYREQQTGGEGSREDEKGSDRAAEETARLNIILDRIAEERKITIGDEEIGGLVKREAARESVDPQKLHSYLVRSGKMEDIIIMLKRNRAFTELEKQYIKKA